ncbi:NAD-dependent epimerase/dehydratase family protein [Leptolyngbya sp. 7M]|uniref:NAD-dependent epimerase/dehydratase family protein n=1 Tax=Leptolyngbya sp. 7M TaxID=2812896 RepID=UPI001B8DA9CA|nr:NAD(P)-dependent oxidoreductase [Leptolyngbya sp. 7M]QYO67364.1 NAD(P)-dependent oxidoreductase [Leptolyngbya sp. 7M]
MELQGKTILITGIGGFIGLRAAEMAVQRGMKVRGIQRTAEKAQAARALGAEVVIGSITDPAVTERACQGVDIVLHTAAIVREEGDVNKFMDTNVGGTLNLAKTAKAAGVRCFVHLSSVMVYGYSYPNHVNESGPLYTGDNPYCKTKVEAEKQLLPLNDSDFGIITIRPGDVYGPRSLVWVVRPLQLMKKRLFVLMDGGRNIINHIYVDNLIDGIFLAIEKEAYGEAFNLTDGAATTWREYATWLSKISGMPKPISLPGFVVRTLVKLRISDDSISMSSIDVLSRRYAYSIEKAWSVLGYQPSISLEEGMARTAEWLRKEDIYSPEWIARAKASK